LFHNISMKSMDLGPYSQHFIFFVTYERTDTHTHIYIYIYKFVCVYSSVDVCVCVCVCVGGWLGGCLAGGANFHQ
jgi:hypothetical protein